MSLTDEDPAMNISHLMRKYADGGSVVNVGAAGPGSPGAEPLTGPNTNLGGYFSGAINDPVLLATQQAAEAAMSPAERRFQAYLDILRTSLTDRERHERTMALGKDFYDMMYGTPQRGNIVNVGGAGPGSAGAAPLTGPNTNLGAEMSQRFGLPDFYSSVGLPPPPASAPAVPNSPVAANAVALSNAPPPQRQAAPARPEADWAGNWAGVNSGLSGLKLR